MTDHSVLIPKTIAAFKGLINTYRLEPGIKEDTLGPEYKSSWRHFTNENNEILLLFYEDKSFSRILEFVDRLFPGQTDNKLVSRLLRDSLTDWITKGKNPQTQIELEKHGLDFIDAIKREIKPRLVFLPIEGLEFKNNSSLTLGNCTLFNNHADSNFKQILLQDRKRAKKEEEPPENHWPNRVKSYLTYEGMGTSNRATERGIEEANLALNILRLFISSYYHDENDRNIVRRMGFSGSLRHKERMRVFHIDPTLPLEEQFPGSRESITSQRNFEIDKQFKDYIEINGLKYINSSIQSLGLNFEGDDIARRLVRTISWFAKATSAKSIADSYLMYAIAIEGLLSEDRTPQETYATQMSALIACQKEDCLIYPLGGYLSIDFANELKSSSSLNERFSIIRKRTLDLFSYRNRIAHGAVMDHEISHSNLLDFETIARNSILAFVNNEWQTFGEFKSWVHKSVGYDFTPIPREK